MNIVPQGLLSSNLIVPSYMFVTTSAKVIPNLAPPYYLLRDSSTGTEVFLDYVVSFFINFCQYGFSYRDFCVLIPFCFTATSIPFELMKIIFKMI